MTFFFFGLHVLDICGHDDSQRTCPPFAKWKYGPSSPVVLKLVGDIEPYKCRAGLHRTPSYNQEWI